MLNFVYVGIGSAVGGLARFALGRWAQQRLDGWAPVGEVPFPIGTLLVNVSGSFLLGVILVVASRQQEPQADALRLLLAVGLCGGYTTFSTFSAETVALLENGAFAPAAVNVVASVALALAGTFAGVMLARVMLGRVA